MNKIRIVLFVFFALIPVIAWSQGKVATPNKQPPVKKETPHKKESSRSANSKDSKIQSKENTERQPEIKYEVLDYLKKTVILKSAIDATGSVIIPISVSINKNNYIITKIGEEAFDHCVDVTSVTIPNSVTTIGLEAFSDCTSLTSVLIPSKFKSEKNDMFAGCPNLNTINYTN